MRRLLDSVTPFLKPKIDQFRQWLQNAAGPDSENHPSKSPVRPRAKDRIVWDEDELESHKRARKVHPKARPKARNARVKSKSRVRQQSQDSHPI